MKNTPQWATRIGPYGIVSAVVTAVDYTVFILAMHFGLRAIPANITSWAVAVLVAYVLHSRITFKADFSIRKFLGYAAVCMLTLLLGTIVLAIANIYIVPLAAKVVSTIVVFGFSFSLSHFTVFRTAKL